MIKIDFAIIGAQKAATTALFEMLVQHPSIYMPETKEDNFFVKDEVYSTGQAHLKLAYGAASNTQLLGLAYVNLLYFAELAAPRMAAHNPRMKLIALLRNPVDRAYSAYWYARMRGWETASTFEEALDNESKGRVSDQFAHQSNLTYLAHGHYADQLAVFIDTFGRDAVHVFFQDELKDAAQPVCSAIFSSLGLPEQAIRQVSANEASRARLSAVSSLIVNDSPVKSLYKKVVPYSIRYFISRNLVFRFQEMNRKPASYPPMADATRLRLEEYYAPHAERLTALLGRSYW